ncbi:hypothetical protein DFH09DRAFT_962668, partial [Mycena vulgaris]
IEERIQALSAQRDKIQSYIDTHKALISHPRRLPPDILGEIFVVCLPVDRDAAPLLLCRICSTWRSIALSTPRLRASLQVSLDFILVLQDEQRIAAVFQWLRLSAACPLSLTFIDRQLSLGRQSGEITPLIDELALFSDRGQINFRDMTYEGMNGLANVHTNARVYPNHSSCCINGLAQSFRSPDPAHCYPFNAGSTGRNRS